MSVQFFEWDNYDYAALCIIPTPSVDASGIAHLVEHLVFRYSDKYPAGHELFVANTLLPVAINASTQDDFTLFYVVSGNAEVFLACLDYLVQGLDQLNYPEQNFELERDGVLQRELQWLEKNPDYWAEAITNRSAPSCIHAGGYSDMMPFNRLQDVQQYKQICYLASHRQWLVNGKSIPTKQLALVGSPSQSMPSSSSPEHQYDQTKLPEVIQKLLTHAIAVEHTQELMQSTREQLGQTLGARNIQPKQPEIHSHQQMILPFPTECCDNAMSQLAQTCAKYRNIEHIPPLPKFIQAQLADYPELTSGEPIQDIQFTKLEELNIEHITCAAFWQPRLHGQCYAMGVGRYDDNIYQYIFAKKPE